MRSVNQRAACANHGQSPVIARRSSTLCRGTARRSANIAVSSYCYLLLLLASVTCFGLSQNVDSVFLSPSRIFLFIFFLVLGPVACSRLSQNVGFVLVFFSPFSISSAAIVWFLQCCALFRIKS